MAAAPAGGPAPLAAALDVATSLSPPSPAAPDDLDLDGDGPFGLPVTGFRPPPVSYLAPGLYQPTLIAWRFDPARGITVTSTARAVVRVDFPAPPPALVSLSLTPEGLVVVKEGALFLDAVGKYADGTTRTVTTLATWTVADQAIAFVSQAGTVRGLAPGLTTVTATLGDLTAMTQVTVTGALLQALAVTPPLRTIPAGGLVPYQATGLLVDGTTMDLTHNVLWSTAEGNIAAIEPGTGRLQAVNAHLKADKSGVPAEVLVERRGELG